MRWPTVKRWDLGMSAVRWKDHASNSERAVCKGGGMSGFMTIRESLAGLNPRQLRQACTMERVASWENLFAAAALARRGKSRRPDVERWWQDREGELRRIREELTGGTWQPGGYRVFTIREPKVREIAAAPFRDRVVHHALCRWMGPVLERRFIARSFSCQVGKGTTAAREACRALVNRHTHVLKCDVRKFYPSLDHGVLMEKLDRWIACPGVRELVRRIVGSFATGSGIPVQWFPGDDLLAGTRPRGLPIGNLTSQLWGNFYLDDMDHALVEGERHGAYVRYTDDFLLFGDDRRELWRLRGRVEEELARVRLKLAVPKSRLLATREGVPFCGFLFRPGLAPRVIGATKRRFHGRLRGLIGQRRIREASSLVRAWFAFSMEGNSLGLRRGLG